MKREVFCPECKPWLSNGVKKPHVDLILMKKNLGDMPRRIRNKISLVTRKKTLLGYIHRVVSVTDILPKSSTTAGQYVTPAQDCFTLLCMGEGDRTLLPDMENIPVCKLPALIGLARLSNVQLSAWAKNPPIQDEIVKWYLRSSNEMGAANALVEMRIAEKK